jgi:hypothetical protein
VIAPQPEPLRRSNQPVVVPQQKTSHRKSHLDSRTLLSYGQRAFIDRECKVRASSPTDPDTAPIRDTPRTAVREVGMKTATNAGIRASFHSHPVFRLAMRHTRPPTGPVAEHAGPAATCECRSNKQSGGCAREGPIPYAFLTDTYDTERIKVVSVWSEFTDEELPVRPRQGDPRGRSVHEQMVHQCVSENFWFLNMLGDVGAPPLPQLETPLAFINRYAEDSGSASLPCERSVTRGGRKTRSSSRSAAHERG